MRRRVKVITVDFILSIYLASIRTKVDGDLSLLIDFGSGSGAYDKILLEKGNLKHISLVDASKTMLEKAHQLLGEANLADKVDIINERFDQISRSEYF